MSDPENVDRARAARYKVSPTHKFHAVLFKKFIKMRYRAAQRAFVRRNDHRGQMINDVRCVILIP